MSTLEGGTYEIIRSRLETQKNGIRKEIFGSIETKLIANNRIITENNCIPSDIVCLGDTCIFGYNVHFGLRTDIKTDDVFSIYKYEEGEFKQQDLAIINDDTFLEDFFNLYKYYRDTEFRKFFITGNYLHMVFQVSDRLSDIKTFKWLIKDDTLIYQDNRSDNEYRFPQQHDFRWQEASRDMHRYGKHPHVSILDKVFVETVGGTLTIKVEDNTTTGKGIYEEEVMHPDQTLDDGNFQYADLGNLIVLQIKPFQEEPRFFVYNHKLQEVKKIDSLSTSAILLPDQHGLIFSNGYYLQTGEYKLFENSLQNLFFQERITSPNGEDYMYVFYEEGSGQYVLMTYNIITHEVTTPITCSGFTILEGGELCYFRAETEHTKNHLVQIWQTPFIKGDIMPTQHKDSYIYKIGNKDIVKAMAESHSIITLLNKDDDYEGLYSDLTRLAQNALDGYYWITSKETFELNIPLAEIKNTANAAIDEFEKVVQLRLNAGKITQEVKDKAETLFIRIKSSPLDNIDVFVVDLAGLRTLRGEVISLKDVRYIEEGFINELESEIVAQTEHISQNCVQFLMDDKALIPYNIKVEEKQKGLDKIATVADARKLEDEVSGITADLEMLIEIVSNLKIEDTSKSTHIINTISLIFATLNRLKADIKNKISSLGGKEAKADFAAQIKLIDQSIVNALDRAVTPEKTDELLNKISVQLEDLEARFADYAEFSESIIEKREEIYTAFEVKKNSLIEARNKKAVTIEGAAERILKNVAVKALSFKSSEEINGYFASDLMIAKLRDLTEQLIELEDTGKAEAIETQLKTAREDALRKLKDKQELYEDGENIIRLGKHKFTVNKQPLDLTIIYKEGKLNYHLTGTDFYQEIKGSSLDSLQKYWVQDLVSENDTVYRGSYLAFKIFKKYGADNLYNMPDEELENIIKEETSKNYTEGYIKGVHDTDAFKILKVLVNKYSNLKLLRYSPSVRALAQFTWFSLAEEIRKQLNSKIKASGSVLSVFPQSNEFDYIVDELKEIVSDFYNKNRWLANVTNDVQGAAHYLFDELKDDNAFTVSFKASQIAESFIKTLEVKEVLANFRRAIDDKIDNESALLHA
mgnify:CR=1 FL=1